MANINSAYQANPKTAIPLDAILYLLDNPGETGGDNDGAINGNDLLAQIIGTRIDGVKLTWNGVASIDVGNRSRGCRKSRRDRHHERDHEKRFKFVRLDVVSRLYISGQWIPGGGGRHDRPGSMAGNRVQ